MSKKISVKKIISPPQEPICEATLKELLTIEKEIKSQFGYIKNFIIYVNNHNDLKAKYRFSNETSYSQMKRFEMSAKSFIRFWNQISPRLTEDIEKERIEEIKRKAYLGEGLSRYYNTVFWMYTYPKNPNKGSPKELDISVLSIDSFGKVLLQNKVMNGKNAYIGDIINLKGNNIFFNLEANEKQVHLKTYKSVGDVPEIILGVYTKIDYSNQIVIGTLILKQIKDPQMIENVKKKEFYDLNELQNISEIDESIKLFFLEKHKNIIKLPTSKTTSDIFKDWLDSKKKISNLNEISIKLNFKYKIFVASPISTADEGWIEKVCQYYIPAIGKGMELNDDEVKSKIYLWSEKQQIIEPNFNSIDESEYFIMFFPHKKISTILMEAGYAYALRKPSIYFVHEDCKESLPNVLQEIGNAKTTHVHIIYFKNDEDLLKNKIPLIKSKFVDIVSTLKKPYQ